MVLSYLLIQHRKASNAWAILINSNHCMLSYGGITRVRFKGCFSLYLSKAKYRPLAMNENYANSSIIASHTIFKAPAKAI